MAGIIETLPSARSVSRHSRVCIVHARPVAMLQVLDVALSRVASADLSDLPTVIKFVMQQVTPKNALEVRVLHLAPSPGFSFAALSLKPRRNDWEGPERSGYASLTLRLHSQQFYPPLLPKVIDVDTGCG